MGAPKCVDCEGRRNLAEQFDARYNRVVWLCAYCHYQGVTGGG